MLFCSVRSSDSLRAERVGAVTRVTSYSAGTERTATADHNAYHLDHHRQAWNNLPSDASTFPTGKPPLPPLSRASNVSDTSQQQMLSKKEEDLSEEWLVDVEHCY